jgi:tetratricopeptide (TPR) repeat protein
MKLGSFINAVKLLSEAVRADANSIVARRYLAYALIRTSRPGDAISQLLFLANMLKPSVPSTFDNYNLGEAYLSTRNFKASQEAFKSVLAVDPKNDAARGGLIKAYAFDQNFPEAMTQLSQGQKNKDPKVQQYYKQLLELIYNTKTAGTVGSASNATVTPAPNEVNNTWQQIGPK